MKSDILLRDVTTEDLPTFFEQQLDPADPTAGPSHPGVPRAANRARPANPVASAAAQSTSDIRNAGMMIWLGSSARTRITRRAVRGPSISRASHPAAASSQREASRLIACPVRGTLPIHR